jgi:esterase
MNPPLHSRILGKGKPLLILHGFLGMLDNWKTLGSRYAEEALEVHLIDQRNHGNSFWSDEFDYDAMASDLRDYMEQNAIEAATILGHSMGGKTAMRFACTWPGRVRKLLVADIGPQFYPPHHDDLLDALYTLPLSQLQSRSEAETALAQKIPDAVTRQFLLKNLYWKEKGVLAFRCNLEVLRDKSAEVGEGLGAFAIYKGPSLFIRGGDSDYISLSDKDSLLRHFPSANVETIAGAGHWLHAEKPEQFFNISTAFINS